MLCLSSNWVTCVSFKPDNPKILVSSSYDKTIKTWDITSGSCLSTLTAHSDWVRAVAWSPCGQWLASGGDDKMIYVYDTKTFEVKWPLKVDSQVLSVAYSPDGTKLTAGLGYPSYSVVVFDTHTNEQIRSLRGHRYAPSLSKECFLSFR